MARERRRSEGPQEEETPKARWDMKDEWAHPVPGGRSRCAGAQVRDSVRVPRCSSSLDLILYTKGN